jgi:hypothetical protein
MEFGKAVIAAMQEGKMNDSWNERDVPKSTQICGMSKQRLLL